MTRIPMGNPLARKILAACIATIVIASPAAAQSRVATSSGTNAKTPSAQSSGSGKSAGVTNSKATPGSNSASKSSAQASAAARAASGSQGLPATTAPATATAAKPEATAPATATAAKPATTAPATATAAKPATTAPATATAAKPATTAPATATAVRPATTAPATATAVRPATTAPATATAVRPATTAPVTAPAGPAKPTGVSVTKTETAVVTPPARPAESKTVLGATQTGKSGDTRTATIDRPNTASIIADANGVATTGPEAKVATIPPLAVSPTKTPPTDTEVAKAVAEFTSGSITASQLTKVLDGSLNKSEVLLNPTAPATTAGVGATGTSDPAATAAPSMTEVTRLTIEAAEAAFQAIPGTRLARWTGELRFASTDWNALVQRAGSDQQLSRILGQLQSQAGSPQYADVTRFRRPISLAEIPPDLMQSGAETVLPERKEMFCLAYVDCSQTSWLSRNGVLVALIAKKTNDPVLVALALRMLEEVNKYVPLQRPGTTIWDPNVPITPGGEGVWLATAWGISAIVDMTTILGDLVPTELRERMRSQVREEVMRICVDWRDKRPWFVKNRSVVSNQWIEPNVGLIKATLWLKDPLLLPAYNLGVENLAASLNAHGASGEFLEGVNYAQMTLHSTHSILGSMRQLGDTRCLNSPFAKNNWRWFTHMHMPGAMIVNCNDTRASELPGWCMSVPYSSFAEAAMASGEDDAVAMMRFLYPTPTPIGALDALLYADFLAASSTPAQARLPVFASFPAQQLVVWRSEFQPIAAPQTALAVWMKGGALSENHIRREQGHVSVYSGNRLVLTNCGTIDYTDPTYFSGYASTGGSNVMQVAEITPSSKPINAPLFVNNLGPTGGDVDIDTSAAYVGATCHRNVSWNIDGRVRIGDEMTLTNPATQGMELYRFHTGNVEPLTITGSGTRWTVTWTGASINFESDKPVTVEQGSQLDRLSEPFHHQMIVIKAVGSTGSLSLVTDLVVDRSVTN